MESSSVNSGKKTLTMETVNPLILTFKAMEYAARGPVILRALEIQRELYLGATKPFTEISFANLGDAHAMGQKPITFVRQVLGLVSHPELIGDSNSKFPSDVQAKAKSILQSCRGGSTGSYADSRGIESIRRHVTEYIQRRDGGIPSNVEDVILCSGASEGIRSILKLVKHGPNQERSGVMIPIPEYPLYNATLGEFDMEQIGYYLDESLDWAVNITELERAITEARKTCNPRAIVVINPGNPTGHVFSKKNMQEIIKFAYRERLIVLADEVYQDNIHQGTKFLSFKKVMMEMDAPYNEVELVSIYSCSKGFLCECGLRSGYCEMVNIDEGVKSILVASIAAKLCSPVLGQAALDCIVDPPKLGDPSFELFMQEKSNILNSLENRAKMIEDVLNSLPGIKCSKIRGTMYAFPRIILSARAIKEAGVRKLEPDVFYALELLERTGVSVVPGSGIGQFPGTYHFRTTVLPAEDKLQALLENFKEFHLQFVGKYADN